jgi:acetyl-CoA C-acetyltransferase
VFSKRGTITVGNSSKLGDGACALVLASATKVKELGTKPLAKIVGYADAATEPVDFAVAMHYAVVKVLQKTGLNVEDISYFELHEQYSVVSLVNMRLLNIPFDVTNIFGGAIALGHPVGMSGARLLLSLLTAFGRKGGG